MTIEEVEARQSGIQGRGLFALRTFEPGDVVLRWDTTHTMPRDKVLSLSEEERRYTHPLDEQRSMIVQPPERFVNHSCSNNTEVRNFCDVAIRRIEVGEEITSDYGSDGSGMSFKCQCGSENCRGMIGC
ncbi:MAG TPA: SET domain-containing protein-lysine N-methyltransferase [Pyrinomonadaceae bacterium]|jgi:SET domain-containing protein|nr:SET domain-containing protein-lysine N-methyltransferase [Pyrinomonadaceae bacterium]